ncbi:MAG: hypothetical protein GX351_11130, partial [Peptococcaceae bacterium]|nr:hypothetical protein [Peptococcaceae bacterium]
MKKEQEILLEPEEIQQLLEGGLNWEDISSRLSPDNSTDPQDSNSREELDEEELDEEELDEEELDEELDLEKVTNSLIAAVEDEEEKSVRAILFGEDKSFPESTPEIDSEAEVEPETEIITQENTAIRTEDEVVINRQIDLSRMEADLKAQPILGDPEVDNELKSILSEQFNAEQEQDLEMGEEEEEEKAPFGGLKLVILLVVVAVLTFAFW